MKLEIDKIVKSTDDFTQAEILELIAKLESTLFDKMDFKEFVQKIMEQKFAEGLVCPRCQNKHVKKNGFDKKGRQKYKCSKCGSFTATTNTVFSKSKISAGKWLKYADCMNKRMSLRETAKELKICLKTAFNMRHKILGAIVESMGVDNLEGLIEMDECFFAECFKGNHKKRDPQWKPPRKDGESRVRGKQVQFRGISHEQICVSCGMDRNGGLVLVPVCNGRLTVKALTDLYDNKIEPNSIICTDSHRAYKKFSQSVPADLVQIERGKHKKDIYHINNINSLHSRLKQWIKPFHGVATKYLTHYMYWFNWQERNKKIALQEKAEQLILESFSAIIIYTQEDIRNTKAF